MELKEWSGLLMVMMFLSGCMGTYGQIRSQGPEEKIITIEDLAKACLKKIEDFCFPGRPAR
jgi:hypothetical protein